ncbi:hypothetical protein CMK14_06670 [Candidatus Poribacteria bacterium]|nr:hypothetical protein [Candidatus Poribacteria bacterium]
MSNWSSARLSFNTSHVAAHQLIQAGAIGNPIQIRQRQGPWFRRPTNGEKPERIGSKAWRQDPELSGNGKYPWMFGHGVHFFALAEYLMLDRTINQVYSSPVPTSTIMANNRLKLLL